MACVYSISITHAPFSSRMPGRRKAAVFDSTVIVAVENLGAIEGARAGAHSFCDYVMIFTDC